MDNALLERFMRKVEIVPGGCWEWRGTLQNRGYPFLSIGGKQKQAHRLSYELHIGPIPEGLTIDHLCRNRACVKPGHLEAVTISVNVYRGKISRLYCRRGHWLSLENTWRKPSLPNERYCRTCMQEKQREKRATTKPRNSQRRISMPVTPEQAVE